MRLVAGKKGTAPPAVANIPKVGVALRPIVVETLDTEEPQQKPKPNGHDRQAEASSSGAQNGTKMGHGGETPSGSAGGADDLDAILAKLPKWGLDRLEDPAAGDRSKALFSVIKKLVELGFDDPTIERIICHFPRGIGSKYIGRKDVGAEISRVRSKTAAGR